MILCLIYPATHPTETRDDTPDITKPLRGSKTLLRSVVTEITTTKVSKTTDTTDENEPESEQNRDTAGNVIEIVPTTEPTLEVGTAATELEPDRDK